MSSSAYIPVPITTDPVDLQGQAFEYLQSRIPGWLPSEGNLEVWLIEALALLAGELRALCALVPQSIFEWYGSAILGIPPYPAVAATALTTWEAVDAAGYTVPAGTVIAITPSASSVGFAFGVEGQFTIPAGTTTVEHVACRALQPGAAANGLTGSVQVIDSLAFIRRVTLEGPTTGGQDAETVAQYLDRLSALLTLLTPRPILPRDFAILAQRMIPGIARATAIDLYNPETGEHNVPRCVTVVVCDDAGEPVAPTIRQAAQDYLRAEREVNFLAFVIDPTFTTVDISFNVRVWPNFNPDDVRDRAVAALTRWLSPGGWGLPPFGDPGSGIESWINNTVVRVNDVIDQLYRVDGVWYVDSVQIGVHGGPLSGSNIGLAGVGPLPRPGTIVGAAHV